MSGNTPMLLSAKSQLGLKAFHDQCYIMYNSQWNLRSNMRLADLAFAREADLTKPNQRARFANRYGDKDRFQNITVPIVMPQVEAAVTYQASVFLTGIPLFGVSADPAYEDQALQLETIIDNNAIRGGWQREFNMFFRDGFKYGAMAALEVSWTREVTAAIETDIGFSATQGKPKNQVWQGNKVKRIDMYNAFFDVRVQPSQMYREGEFFGYTELISRVALKKFMNELPDKMIVNEVAAFESAAGSIGMGLDFGALQSYYIPEINPIAFLNFNKYQTTNWLAWAQVADADTNKIQYKNMYEKTVLYARIIPSDFNIKCAQANTPQIWKFIFINHQILIYAERQTNAHNYLPILMGQPLEDGLGYQTKSLADNVGPIQDITSAISNASIASRRRSISDRTLYDPSRIAKEHINSENPSAKIPVRPAAYGKTVADAVHAFPFRDDQAGINSQEISQYSAMANMISGQNQVRQGQFVKGNKTQHEYADVMSHANGRDQQTAMMLEAQVMTPLKEILMMDILQYQGATTLFNREKKRTVPVDPSALRTAVLSFKVSDGLTPTDKLINADTMQVALQVIGSSPQIAPSYNVGPLFSYLMKTQGAILTPFEKSQPQIAYEQAMQQYQQMVIQLYKQNPDLQPTQLPPQPTPQQFGYNPNANDPSKGPTAAQPTQGAMPAANIPIPSQQPIQQASAAPGV